MKSVEVKCLSRCVRLAAAGVYEAEISLMRVDLNIEILVC